MATKAAKKSPDVVEAPPAPEVEVVIEDAEETHRVADVLSASGRGLHVAGSAIADFDLRLLGKGLKSLGRRVPRVRFEKRAKAPKAKVAKKS